MLSKCRMILLGLVISHGAILVAMQKEPKSPRGIQSSRRPLLSCSAELRKSNDQLKKETMPIQISISKNQVAVGMCYNHHCGSRSPVDYIPYCSELHDKISYGHSDCP